MEQSKTNLYDETTAGPIRISMQFFGEEVPPAEDEGAPANEGKPTGTEAPGTKTEKTFTQAEVNAMMAKEKSSGKNSILKSLGFNDEKTAKESMTAYQKFLESQKTETEKNQEKITSAETARAAAEQKAQKLEYNFQAVKLGVNLDAVDDVVALAMTKVTEEKDFEAVLTELKAKPAYSGFFKEPEDTDSGTGGNPGFRKPATGKKSIYGERLAGNTTKAPTKSAYFK